MRPGASFRLKKAAQERKDEEKAKLLDDLGKQKRPSGDRGGA